MQIKVTIDGMGNYTVDSDKIYELISWLNNHQSVQINKNQNIREVINDKYPGQILLNENSGDCK